MEPGALNLEIMSGRLEKLERQNRRMKQAGAVVLLFAGALLLMGQAPPRRMVEANEFVLKDGNGRVRAILSAATSPTLYFLDENGVNRAALGPSGLALSSGERQLAAMLGGASLQETEIPQPKLNAMGTQWPS